ncbi:MAG: cation diffusion facilitator transporter [Rhodothermaceae bacterium]|nr:MAG: cation diffusion facilitator transporter [Rhodothermaceae bacterium]
MAASLAVSFLMLAGKMTAYFITGSAAILSDALESVIHLFATGFAAFSLWYAVRPPDAGHPYGHGKIAYFSSGFEGGLILIAAVTILYSAVRALIEGPALRQLDVGLWILAGLTLVNLALGLALVRVGRRHRSLVLEANGRHVLTDMWTSLGVLAGVGLVALTGLTWLDPLVAIVVALNILWTAVRLVRTSVSGLMEAADTADTQAILTVLDQAVAEGLISGYHQVRHRRVNDQLWIEYHLLFPEDLRIPEAHERSHVVEERLARALGPTHVYVTAHLEPETHDEAHPEGHREPADPLLLQTERRGT